MKLTFACQPDVFLLSMLYLADACYEHVADYFDLQKFSFPTNHTNNSSIAYGILSCYAV